MHLVLTALPGAAAVLLAVRKGVVQIPVLLAIGLAASGVAATLCFWLYFANPLAGNVFSVALAAASAWAVMYLGHEQARVVPRLLKELSTPLLLWILGTVFLVFFGFLHGGSDVGVSTSAIRFTGQLPSDNYVPYYFASSFFEHGSSQVPAPYPGDWLSSDRPPLQIGYILADRIFVFSEETVSYQMHGVVLQQLWIVGLWAVLAAARIGHLARLLVMLTVLVSDFAIINGFFVWPKMLPAAMTLAAAAIIISPDWKRWSRDPRFGALIACLAALALLAHGSSIFALIALAALGLWRSRPSPRWIATGVAVGLLLLVPWSAYQSFFDPPGNRLVKWQLGGQTQVDDRGTAEAIIDGFREAGLSGTVRNKLENFGEIGGTIRAGDAAGAVADVLTGSTVDGARKLREVRFFSFAMLIGPLLLAFPLMAIAVLRGRQRRTPEWKLAVACVQLTVIGCVVWGLLIYGGVLARSVVHVGSYALPILALTGAVCGLLAGYRRFGVALILFNALFTLTLMVPALTPPLESSYLLFPALLAAACLAGFIYVAYRGPAWAYPDRAASYSSAGSDKT